MPRQRLLKILFTTVIALAVPVDAQEPLRTAEVGSRPIPAVIPASDQLRPHQWVSARFVDDAYDTGKQDQLVPPLIREFVSLIAQSSEEATYRASGCVATTFEFDSWVHTPGNLEELSAVSDKVLHGTIVSKEAGFLAETYLGQLYRVRIEGAIKDQGMPTGSHALVFFLGGEAEIRSTRICVSSPGFPDAPAIGDEVLFFSDRLEPDGVIVPAWGGFLYQKPAGHLEGHSRWIRSIPMGDSIRGIAADLRLLAAKRRPK